MRAYRARHSRSKVKPTVRLAWSLVVVIAVVGLCGFTLYWTQSRLDTVSARVLVTADRTRVNGKLPDQTSLDLADADWSPSCRTGTRAWLLTPTMSRQVTVLDHAERCRSGLTERS